MIAYTELGEPKTESITLQAFARLDRDSYYRCSTGSPTIWPILAIGWLVLRRRRT